MFFAYKTEDLAALILDTPLIFCKIVSEIFSLSKYIMKNEEKAKQSICNEKYEIVLHNPLRLFD